MEEVRRSENSYQISVVFFSLKYIIMWCDEGMYVRSHVSFDRLTSNILNMYVKSSQKSNKS